MRDRDTIVRIDVKHEVLVGTHNVGSKAAALAFETNRKMIERLASAKYDSHDFVAYANGAVVAIAAEDWDPLVANGEVGSAPRKAIAPDAPQPLAPPAQSSLAQSINVPLPASSLRRLTSSR
jgi:hypothetical protein